MQKNADRFSMQEVMRLAQSDTGQQLLALLKRENGAALQQAMDQAAAGDYAQVQKTMSSLLTSPEAQALLRQLGGNGNE